MDCPWSQFAPATVKFCESAVCSWIQQPSNTWSNLAFVFAGIYLTRHAMQNRLGSLTLIGLSTIFVGIGSFLFHMSGTFLFEVFDMMGMFMISGIMIAMNIRRLFDSSHRVTSIIYLGLLVTSFVLLLMIRPIGMPLFATQIAIAVTVELFCHLRRDPVAYSNYLWMCLSFVVAFTFWNLDISGRLCDPDNHLLTGHAVWHCFNAIALVFLYRFYRQFHVIERGVFSLRPRGDSHD